MRLFLTSLEKKTPRSLDRMVLEADKSTWVKTDCLHCANCCKTMSPTYTRTDMKRISSHLGMTVRTFKKKWLEKDKGGDWLNKSLPCQFLDLNTNMCTIYDVRPRDCAGFPHHTRKRMVEFMHVHKQNIATCPATYRMVERLMEKVSALELF
jgi:Fe-S-cluster containining protein